MGKRRGDWARIDAAMPHDKKSDRLARRLRDPRAWTYVVALWLWSIRQDLGGELAAVTPEEVAEGAGWKGDPEEFLEALVASGWVDRDATGLRLHDWELYNGRYMRQQEQDRQSARDRMRTLRALEKLGGAAGALAAGGAPPSAAGAPATSVEEPPEGSCSGERSGARSHARAPSRPVLSRSVGEVRRGAGGGEPAELEVEEHSRELGDFALWWSAYPERARRFGSRGKAWRRWEETRAVRPPLASMLRRLAAQTISRGWGENGGEFVPLPENYLHDARWMDVADPGPPNQVPVAAEPEAAPTVPDRLRALAEALPEALPDRAGWRARVLALDVLGDELEQVEEQLAALDKLFGEELWRALPPADQERVRSRVAKAASPEALPYCTRHQREDVAARLRRQALREEWRAPVLSLFATEAGA